MSGRERAMMEQMRLVRSNNDLEKVCMLMEGLTTVRPAVIQELPDVRSPMQRIDMHTERMESVALSTS